MSASRPTQSSNLSNRTGQSTRARILQRTVLEAVLDANYEEHGDSFDYSKLFESQRVASNQQCLEKAIAIPYLQELKKGNLIQPFGCLLALDVKTFKVIAFSENAPEMLTEIGHADDSPNLCIGTNIVTLFADPGATALNMVLGLADASSLNPIIVQCKASGEPFYAIVHQVMTDCLVVDFEPVNPSEFPTAVAWASQPYKLAATAISKIQSLPGGNMQDLCNTIVQEVFDLMGYDRVMAYKFHEDFHGEVIAEMTKPGIELYLGLHHPATDIISEAARLLVTKNKVCMISDCRMKPVKIIEDEELPFHVSLCGSALRAPYSCHLQYMKNMKSVASLVIAVVVNEDGEVFEVATEEQQTEKNQRKKLWGLIVCHHGSPRYVPFPLRHACEFIGQVFAIHISKEIELEKRMQERSILCMQQHTLQVQQASEKTTLERSTCLDLWMDEFVLQDMLVAAISKVQTACQGKGIIVSCDLPVKFLKQRLYGDCIQVQKILSHFLFASVNFCPIGGSVTISSNRTKNSIGENIDLIDLELRIEEQVIVVPEEILAHMFQEGHGHQLEQGLTLVVCRNLLRLMN